jgi:hypothetical protein
VEKLGGGGGLRLLPWRMLCNIPKARWWERDVKRVLDMELVLLNVWESMKKGRLAEDQHP